MDYFQDCVIAKKRKIIKESCDKADFFTGDKGLQVKMVYEDFKSKYEPSKYFIQSDGLSTQQPIDKHQYVVKYYEDVEDVLNVERYY